MAECFLFLDIDGVLLDRDDIHNTIKPVLRHMFGAASNYTLDQRLTAEVRLFNEKALQNLDRLLTTHPNLKIVISSNWRAIGEVDVLKYYLGLHRFASRIVSRTGKDANRGLEINHWLQWHLQERLQQAVVRPATKPMVGRAVIQQIQAHLQPATPVATPSPSPPPAYGRQQSPLSATLAANNITYIILDDNDDGLSQLHPQNFILVNRRELLTSENIQVAQFKLLMQQK